MAAKVCGEAAHSRSRKLHTDIETAELTDNARGLGCRRLGQFFGLYREVVPKACPFNPMGFALRLDGQLR
jgi:hypothetical protein